MMAKQDKELEKIDIGIAQYLKELIGMRPIEKVQPSTYKGIMDILPNKFDDLLLKYNQV